MTTAHTLLVGVLVWWIGGTVIGLVIAARVLWAVLLAYREPATSNLQLDD